MVTTHDLDAVRTPELVAATATKRSGAIALLEPPVDTVADHPGVDGSAFRAALPGGRDMPTVVLVSRLAVLLKLDCVVTAIDAVAEVAQRRPVRLVIVGGGDAYAALAARAAARNAALGREAIVLTGPTVDPRPAYAAADVVVGMGSSVLRGMAFGKPAIVVGEGGFAMPVNPDTVALFLEQGFYGVGSGDAERGASPLAAQLEAILASSVDDRERLGGFGRALVESRYSLRRAADVAAATYRDTLDAPAAGSLLADAAATAARVARWKVASRLRRTTSARVTSARTSRAGVARDGSSAVAVSSP
jgi:glycosyltransferase involved in cell wall biosynthesis